MMDETIMKSEASAKNRPGQILETGQQGLPCLAFRHTFVHTQRRMWKDHAHEG